MPEKIVLHVGGLHCASCVRRLEEGLGSQPGVRGASVNLLAEKATVEFDLAATDVSRLVKAVEEIGYEVLKVEESPREGLRKLTVSVGGMTCAACVRRVEQAIGTVPGVRDVSVNLATARAAIVYDPSGWGGVDGVRRVLLDTGYEYLGVLDEMRDDPIAAAREREIRDLRIRVTVGAVLSLLVFMGSMQH